MRRLTALITGTVQKTGYRAKVVYLANFLGLMGFVQNLPDGRVKVVAEGEEAALERFLNDLKIKEPLIDVQDIEIKYASAMGDFIRFEKMVGDGETDQRLDKAAELLSDLIVSNKQIVAQLIINNEELKGVREEVKGVREEVKGSRQDIRAVHEEVKGVREEVKGSRQDIRAVHEEVKGVREEVKGSRQDIRAVHEEVKGVREEVKGSREEVSRVCESVQDVRQEVNSAGEMIAEKIDDAREEIAGETKELRSDLRDDLRERMIRMEADVSQIKARIGL
jgi:acylphosphatase/uncharacterized coiled-coil DUF342 family protein